MFVMQDGEQGWCMRSGESTGLKPMWPGFDFRTPRGKWAESRPCSEWFFAGYSGFPLSAKTNLSTLQYYNLIGNPRAIGLLVAHPRQTKWIPMSV